MLSDVLIGVKRTSLALLSGNAGGAAKISLNRVKGDEYIMPTITEVRIMIVIYPSFIQIDMNAV